MHFVQQLKLQDNSAHLVLTLRFLEMVQGNEYWTILCADEAHFHLDGAVNTQNCRLWYSTIFHAVQQQTLDSPYGKAYWRFTAIFILGHIRLRGSHNERVC